MPRQQANPTHPHPRQTFTPIPCGKGAYRVLILISKGYPRAWGRLDTRCSPIRRSPAESASAFPAAPRLACVRPVASVHPEPGSNSSLQCFVFSDFHLMFVCPARLSCFIFAFFFFMDGIDFYACLRLLSFRRNAYCLVSLSVRSLSMISSFVCYDRSPFGKRVQR